MQIQKMQTGLRCPNCEQNMQGYSVTYHNYNCSRCGTGVEGLVVRTNSGIEQFIGALCVVGLIVLFANILK